MVLGLGDFDFLEGLDLLLGGFLFVVFSVGGTANHTLWYCFCAYDMGCPAGGGVKKSWDLKSSEILRRLEGVIVASSYTRFGFASGVDKATMDDGFDPLALARDGTAGTCGAMFFLSLRLLGPGVAAAPRTSILGLSATMNSSRASNKLE